VAASRAKGAASKVDASADGSGGFFGFLRGGRVVGHGSGKKRPSGSRLPSSRATKIRRTPWAKQLNSRGRDRFVALRRAMCSSGSASNSLWHPATSASPPTLTTHKVATAMANHKRVARAGSVILV